MRSLSAVVVTVLVGCVLLGEQPARADEGPAGGPPVSPIPGISAPSPLQGWIDNTIPAPALDPAPQQPAGEAQSSLWHAVLPLPSGDPTFDAWPDNLDTLSPGQLIEWRDVTATTAPFMTTPIQRLDAATPVRVRPEPGRRALRSTRRALSHSSFRPSRP
ncbi:hypothetical protein OIE68_02190 [Nocardia vinacea]|uniref:hypothetical protein n=1 Tax=Nocardia vinacea TaxID=96468 RepID=UPI002E11B31A|nr:hypothetical protein OIE68_02190 [Nocardia vinacea]